MNTFSNILKKPILQSMFSIKGLKGLVNSEVRSAELRTQGQVSSLSILYRLHEDFELKTLFDQDRRSEFNSREVSYKLFLSEDLSKSMTLVLHRLELRSVSFVTDATSNDAVLIELDYYVDAIM